MAVRDIAGAVARHAAARPDAVAIIAPGERLTWATLDRRCRVAMAGLAASGVGPGTIAMVRLPNDVPHIVVQLALVRLGVPFIGIDTGQPGAERRRQAGVIGATTIVTDDASDALPGLGLVTADAAWWRRAEAAPEVVTPPPPPGQLLTFATSSGTTGAPKLIAWTHRQMRAQFDAADGPIRPTAATRYLAVIAPHFSVGRRWALRVLDAGGTLALPPPLRSSAQLAALVAGLAPVATVMTPSHVRHLLAELPAEGGPHMPGLDPLHVTTGPLHPREVDAARARIAPNVIIGYGTNETGLITVLVPDDDRTLPGNVGRLLAGVRGEVIDGEGNPLPPGFEGELRVRRPHAPRGYLPGETSAVGAGAFRNGWLHTGDVAVITPDGYVLLHGRVDDQINVGGLKVHPGEIEAVLQAHPAVAEAAVVAAPAHFGGEAPVAFFTAQAPIDAEALRAHCARHLEPHKVPLAIYRIETLPRNPMGKVVKRALREDVRRRVEAGDRGTR
ncbi:MAG: class I adenylate-forming enzyme family protein [Alphaproteobacteria bacterium]